MSLNNNNSHLKCFYFVEFSNPAIRYFIKQSTASKELSNWLELTDTLIHSIILYLNISFNFNIRKLIALSCHPPSNKKKTPLNQ